MHPFIPQNTLSFYHQTKYFPLNIIYIENIIYLLYPSTTYNEYGINLCNKRYIQSFIPVLRKPLRRYIDITINEAMLLCCLKDGETKSAGMICEYIGLSNSRVSKVITAVENKGYIRRNINKNDKRQMCFSLTPGGKEKIQQMMNAELCFDGLFEKLKTCMEKG